MESLSDLFKDKRKLHKLGEQVQFVGPQVDYEYNKQNILKLICYIRFLFFLRYKCLSFSMVSEVWPTVCFLDLSCTDCSHC